MIFIHFLSRRMNGCKTCSAIIGRANRIRRARGRKGLIMEFKDIQDGNGTHLQSYAETLAEKDKEAGLVEFMVFVSKEKGFLHTITTSDGSLPQQLIALGKKMASEQPTEWSTTPAESEVSPPV